MAATTTRDYAAEYRAARVERERSTTVGEQFAAEDKARAIDAAAEAAGVEIDIVDLGEQARLEVHGDKPWWKA